MLWRAEHRLVGIVPQQQYAEIVIAHVGRKVIPHHARDALAGLTVDNIRFQYFNQRQRLLAAFSIDTHLDRNDVKLDGVAVAFGVIPMRQGVEAVIYHPQGAAQVLLPARAPRQVGEVSRNAGVFGRVIVLVEANALDGKLEVFIRHDRKPAQISIFSIISRYFRLGA
ncbi:hypothetical protein D3C80_1197250 [compost metagenome]